MAEAEEVEEATDRGGVFPKNEKRGVKQKRHPPWREWQVAVAPISLVSPLYIHLVYVMFIYSKTS